ncbi:HNH endonuclease [Vibrio ostreicida]|uniref:HNH endonuclease n=1 Tax=Vibrio ostreicida TaxID=526588 RepID=UPI003B5C66A0
MNTSLLNAFKASSGAFSEVTPREATGDKSVTIDRDEKTILHQVYHPNTFTRVGGAAPDGKQSHCFFYVRNFHSDTYDLHQLAIKYPKAQGNELRLYFNRESHFYPAAGTIWYIFTRSSSVYPFIGFMDSVEWERLTKTASYDNVCSLDEEDDSYQKVLHSPQAQQGVVKSSATRYPRNPSLAAQIIKFSNHQCQYDSSHQSFISASSSQQYVEVHHLIPISYMRDFKYSLDVAANLIVLCPNCHKTVHFGMPEIKRLYLTKFHYERAEDLIQAGIYISLQDLFSLYDV